MDDGKIEVHQGGSSIVIKTDFGLHLTYDTLAGVVLTLPSTYGGVLRGLCGDFNGDPSDDFALAGQTGEPSVGDFIAAWTSKDVPCEPGCKGPTCTETGGSENPITKHCDIIKSPKGPLAGCMRQCHHSPTLRLVSGKSYVLFPMSHVLCPMSIVQN